MADATQNQQMNDADGSKAKEEIQESLEKKDPQKTDENENGEIQNETELEGVEKVEKPVEGEVEGKEEGEGEGKEDGEGEGDEIDTEKDQQVPEAKVEKPLDHDQDRRNPQYIPKGGAFYEHDNRTSLEDVENKDPQDLEKKKKVWKESKESERWLHDWYKESEQQPKTTAEIVDTYGYDIRNEEAPPRARRRRKYGRGPDKYERNWEDEQAYMVKQNVAGRRGRRKTFGKDEFPPLPNRKSDSSGEKTSPNWKREEDSINKKTQKANNNNHNHNHNNSSSSSNNSGSYNQENSSGPSQMGRNDYSYANRNGVQGVNSRENKKNFGYSKKFNKEEVAPFRQSEKTKWKNNNFRKGKSEDVSKPNKSKPANQGESQISRTIESNKNYSVDSDVSHVAETFSQMTFHNKHSNMRDNRQDSNELGEQELDSPANRLNPKRYSKNRKGFTGFFPPEEIVEIDPVEIKQLQQEQQQKSQHVSLQQQPLNIQSVIRRYPGTYNGNQGYIPPRPIITGIPQQGMSPQGLQQALSPQGIPQQALSPQVPGLQPIELQQGPIPPQPNFVPPMYIDMDPHYGPSEMMGPYTGYAPYSANQPGEMYQPSGGITYYNTECQNSNQIRAPPARRQKAAIPILPPPE